VSRIEKSWLSVLIDAVVGQVARAGVDALVARPAVVLAEQRAEAVAVEVVGPAHRAHQRLEAGRRRRHHRLDLRRRADPGQRQRHEHQRERRERDAERGLARGPDPAPSR
jgi:hypothetical protein